MELCNTALSPQPLLHLSSDGCQDLSWSGGDGGQRQRPSGHRHCQDGRQACPQASHCILTCTSCWTCSPSPPPHHLMLFPLPPHLVLFPLPPHLVLLPSPPLPFPITSSPPPITSCSSPPLPSPSHLVLLPSPPPLTCAPPLPSPPHLVLLPSPHPLT